MAQEVADLWRRNKMKEARRSLDKARMKAKKQRLRKKSLVIDVDLFIDEIDELRGSYD